jgi:membrane peptidoglycan carboxypeptidase
VNDHRNHRYRESEPAWPTGDAPNPRASARHQPEEAPERTGFWSPLWEDDEDEPSGRPNGHARDGGGHRANGNSNGGGGHQWPDSEPPSPTHRAEPPAPPRPSSRSASPAWPSAEPPPGTPSRRPGGPHTPPPGQNGFPPPGVRPSAGPAASAASAPTRFVRPAGPGRPGGGAPAGPDMDSPTELLPPVGRGPGPEPELLTHREPDYDEDLNDDPDLDEDYYEDEGSPLTDEQRKKQRRKKIWRRVRRSAYVMTALMIIVPIVAFFVAYQMVEVPDAAAVAERQGQVVTLQYSDGAQLSTIVPDGQNRTMVEYNQIPDVVLHAVFAAEDAEFMTNPGFDITGVMRAGWNQVTGGAGGGSTITQQYIKMATGNDEKSYTRKALEVVKAYKMNKTYTKQQIITAYLNTIYFGRSAYGIVAAAKAYYGKPLDKLTPSEAALLGGMIQSPGRDQDTEYMNGRWTFVMNQMVDKKWLPASERSAAKFPPLIPRDQARPHAVTGPGAHIQRAVLEEVKDKANLTLADLHEQGLTIVTTINKPAQEIAQVAIASVMEGEPTNLFPAMTVIDPKTGAVLAYYGGGDGNGIDWAKQRQEPGSSFKPFDLVALLEKGMGLGQTYDGTSGRTFDGRKVRNSGGASCGTECTVATAMEKSINTVFYDIALNEVGTQKVADAAHQAGIKSPLEGENGGAPDANISIGGGKTLVSTYEMASAYATFAANGMYRTPHLVSKIVDSKGAVVWQPEAGALEGKPAFDAGNADRNRQIARNVTESLKPVPKYSRIPCANSRECAGKTGTHQFGATEDNAKAWMVGYTPQVSAAVSMAAEENRKQVPLKNAKGAIIYGSGLPGKIWKKFMDDFLKDAPKESFGKYEPIGKAAPKSDEGNASNRQSNSQSPSDSNSRPPDSSTDPPTDTQTQPTGPTGPSNSNGPPIPTLGGIGPNNRPPG